MCDGREPSAQLCTHLNRPTGSPGSHTRAAASLLAFAALPLALDTPKESLLSGCTGREMITLPRKRPQSELKRILAAIYFWLT